MTYRQSYQCQSAIASALRQCVPCAGEEACGTAETWTCDSCCVVNPADRASCQLCDEQMPTWKCERCVQVNSATRTVCRHCHTPLVRSAATFIAHGRPTGQTGAVAAPVAAGNDRAGCRAQAQALLGGRSVVFFDESPETMLRGESKDGLCVGGLVSTHESAGAAKQQWPDRAPSTYYGCRVQVESTWCALKGKCGRILSVVSPLCVQEQGPRDQLPRDAVGRIVMEDGAVRMHVAGSTTSKVPSPFCPFLCTFLLRCLPASTPRPQLHGRR